MEQNGVQNGARPLKTCLHAPQSIHFGPKHILDALEWVGRPQNPTCENFTSRGPFKGFVTQQGPRGAKMGQDGVQKGALLLKTCLQAPQSIHFWSQTHIGCTGMGWEAPGPDL